MYLSGDDYQDEKMVKMPKKYILSSKIITEYDGYDKLEREVGTINLKTIPVNDLYYLLSKCTTEGMHKKNSCDYINPIFNWFYELRNYELNFDSVKNIFLTFFNYEKCKEKLDAVKEVMAKCCTLEYKDYNNYVYYGRDEHPHPSQKDINHNSVGKYTLVYNKPLPIKFLKALAQRVSVLEKERKEKNMKKFDLKSTTINVDSAVEILSK